MKKSTTAFATLCSLSICLWGYQAGVWQFAIPMVLALEARAFIKPRWKISPELFQTIHVLSAFAWLLSIFYLPIHSPTPIPYAASDHLIKCLPTGLFPLILCQTYANNFTSIYQALLKKFYGLNGTINLYYPYFGICLFAASLTGGNIAVFIVIAAVLVAGFLGSLRSPRFSAAAFYGLMSLALILSLAGTHQFYWLQANVKLQSPNLFNDLIQNIASNTTKERRKGDENTFTAEALKEANKQIQEAVVSAQREIQSNQGMETTQNAGTTPSPTPPTGTAQSTETPQTNPSQSSTPSAEATPRTTGSASGTETSPSGTPPTSTAGAAQSNGTSQSAGSSSSSPTGGTAASQQPNLPGGGSGNMIASAQGATQGATQSVSGTGTQGQNANQSSGSPSVVGGASVSQASSQSANGGSSGGRSSGLIAQGGGSVDPRKSQTQIGKTGALLPSDAILFRVRPNPALGSNRPEPTFPLYMREATYNQYNSGVWDAVQPKNSPPPSRTSQQRWTLGTQTPNTASVQISAHLHSREEPLKLPLGTTEIDRLAVDAVQVNQYGTVTVQGNPGEIAYTVQFDPTQPLDSAPTQLDLAIPQAEQGTMQKVIASLKLQGKSGQDAVQTVSDFFERDFQYSLTLPPPPKNTTPLSTFLLDHRSGHCEYFASATSLLLRSAGIPTRYVVGYAVQEYSPSEQQYIVRYRNAHAWVMAYVNGAWRTVDTTPASGLFSNGNGSTTPEGQPVENGTAAPTPAGESSANAKAGNAKAGNTNGKKANGEKAMPQPSFAQTIQSFPKKVSEVWSVLTSAFSKRPDTVLWAAGIIGLGLAIIFCSIFFLWRARRKKRPQRARWLRRSRSKIPNGPLPDGLDSEFYLIEKQLGEWGLARQSSETVRQWMVRLKQKLPEAKIHDLHQIIDLHYCYRFDPQGIDPADRVKLRSMIQSWLLEATI